MSYAIGAFIMPQEHTHFKGGFDVLFGKEGTQGERQDLEEIARFSCSKQKQNLFIIYKLWSS